MSEDVWRWEKRSFIKMLPYLKKNSNICWEPSSIKLKPHFTRLRCVFTIHNIQSGGKGGAGRGGGAYIILGIKPKTYVVLGKKECPSCMLDFFILFISYLIRSGIKRDFIVAFKREILILDLVSKPWVWTYRFYFRPPKTFYRPFKVLFFKIKLEHLFKP